MFFCFAGCKHLVITTQIPPRFFLKAPAADRGGVPTLADQRSRGHLMSPGQNSHDCDIFKDPLKIEFCWLMLRNYCNMFCHVLSMENHNSTTPRMMFLMFSWAKQYKSFRQCFLWGWLCCRLTTLSCCNGLMALKFVAFVYPMLNSEEIPSHPKSMYSGWGTKTNYIVG